MKPQDSQRLTFNLINQSYLEKLFKLHSNLEVMKFVRKPDTSLEDTQRTIDKQIANAKLHEGLGLFCAHLKSDNSFIGWGYIYHLDFNEDQPIELGYRLAPQFWGKGYASEIAKTLTDYGRNELKLPKICAVTDPDHEISQLVLKKAGFQYIDNRSAYGHLCSYFEHAFSYPS